MRDARTAQDRLPHLFNFGDIGLLTALSDNVRSLCHAMHATAFGFF